MPTGFLRMRVCVCVCVFGRYFVMEVFKLWDHRFYKTVCNYSTFELDAVSGVMFSNLGL